MRRGWEGKERDPEGAPLKNDSGRDRGLDQPAQEKPPLGAQEPPEPPAERPDLDPPVAQSDIRRLTLSLWQLGHSSGSRPLRTSSSN